MPYYLSIGMPSHEFWEGDPRLAAAYREAHMLRNEQRNQEMWWQGAYFSEALRVNLANAFGKKKGERPEQYLSKPIRITPLTEQEKADRAEAARKKLIADLTAWEKRFNKNTIAGGGGQHVGND